MQIIPSVAPTDIDLPEKTVIDSELGVTNLKNISGKGLRQIELRAGQPPHTHQRLQSLSSCEQNCLNICFFLKDPDYQIFPDGLEPY